MFSDVIDLITYIETPGELGQTEKAPQYREVYCDTRSVQSQEFYAAATAGYKPEIVFEMRRVDYHNERALKYSGGTFRVIRTFTSKKNSEMIELVCESVVADV